MGRLIKELKEDHAAIITTLLGAKALKIVSYAGQERILSAMELFINHLDKEDREFYPVLKEAAESDEKLRTILNQLEGDMEKVSATASMFFGKYSAGNFKNKTEEKKPKGIFKFLGKNSKAEHIPESDFAADFEEFYRILIERINREEKTLYAIFESLNA